MNSEKILKGVPKAYYGAGGVTPFPICLKAVSDFLGDPLDYTYAIVASGGAFRFAWDTAEWNPGNVAINHAYDDPERPFRQGVTALGRDFQILWREGNNEWWRAGTGTKEDFKAFIRVQIDAGKPVIALGPLGPPEAAIITGYRDGGDTLLGWSLFQWDAKTFSEEGYFTSTDYWDKAKGNDFVAVMSLGDVTAPRMGVKQIVENAIAALEGRQEGKVAKGVAAYDAWKKALLGATEKDFAMECGGQNLVMMCQGDATDCLADGRHNANVWFKRLAEENPAEPLYGEIAEQFAIVAKTITEKVYPLLGGYERGAEQTKALEQPETRRQIAAHIDSMKAADEKALALMKELLAAM